MRSSEQGDVHFLFAFEDPKGATGARLLGLSLWAERKNHTSSYRLNVVPFRNTDIFLRDGTQKHDGR